MLPKYDWKKSQWTSSIMFPQIYIVLSIRFFIFAWLFRFIAKFVLIPLIDIYPIKAENTSRIILSCVCVMILVVCIIRQIECCSPGNACIPDRCQKCRKRHTIIRWTRFVAFFVIQWTWLYVEIHLIRQETKQGCIFILGGVISISTLMVIMAIPKVVHGCMKTRNRNTSVDVMPLENVV